MILAADEGTHDAALVEKVKAKNRGVLDGYKTQKVSRKVEKAQREDWEVDEDEMNKDYQRMVARKEKKASAELNEAGHVLRSAHKHQHLAKLGTSLC